MRRYGRLSNLLHNGAYWRAINRTHDPICWDVTVDDTQSEAAKDDVEVHKAHPSSTNSVTNSAGKHQAGHELIFGSLQPGQAHANMKSEEKSSNTKNTSVSKTFEP